MTRRSLSAVVLAAGQGSRMLSDRPKPLHLLCGRPMVLYALDSLAQCDLDSTVVVVGQAAERITKRVSEELPERAVEFVDQPHPRGSADATYGALAAMTPDDMGEQDVVVLAGDMPLLEAGTVSRLVDAHREGDFGATVLLSRPAKPHGGIRVVRGKENRIVRIVAEAELAPDETPTDEVAAVAYVFRRGVLGAALRRITPEYATGELPLNGVVEVLATAGYRINSLCVDDPAEVAEVNDRVSLATIEAELRRQINRSWLERGVTMIDPTTVYIDAAVQLGRDVTIFPNTLLQGRTAVGVGAELGPDTRLVDCMIGSGARVQKVVGQDAEVGPNATVGPFVTLEVGAQVPADANVVPFTTVRGD